MEKIHVEKIYDFLRNWTSPLIIFIIEKKASFLRALVRFNFSQIGFHLRNGKSDMVYHILSTFKKDSNVKIEGAC